MGKIYTSSSAISTNNKIRQAAKHKINKTDRKMLQILLNVAYSECSVNIAQAFKHELSYVPLPLATTCGTIIITTKANILNVLTVDLSIENPQLKPSSDKPTCVIINGHALTQAVGKP